MRLYVAGPLFTEAECAFNLVLARALEAAGHDVYLPQRDSPPAEGAERTRSIFRANLAALAKADAVVAVCDGSQVDDGTAWEIGYAYRRNIQVFGLRTDARIGQQPDERVNSDPRVAERALINHRPARPHATLRPTLVTRTNPTVLGLMKSRRSGNAPRFVIVPQR